MTPSDIKGLVELARNELRHPKRLVGMGLFWGWLQIVFSAPALTPKSPAFGTAISLHETWTISLFFTVGIFAIALLPRKKSIAESRMAIILSHILMSSGTLLLAWTTAAPVELPLLIMATAATGIGSGLAFLCWGNQLAQLKPRQVLFDSSCFALITVIVYGISSLLPHTAAAIFAAILPLISGFDLMGLYPNPTQPATPNLDQAMHAQSKVALLGLAALIGLAYGIIQGASLSIAGSSIASSTTATVIGIAAASVLLVATTAFYRKESELYLLCEISFPLLIGGYLLLPYESGSIIPLPLAVFTAGHTYFYFMLWVFCVDQSKASGEAPEKTFAAGLLSFLGSSLLGSLASDLLAYGGYANSRLLGTLSIVITYGFILVLIFLFGRAKTGKGQAEIDNQRTSLFLESAEQIAAQNKLTPRETEIFLMIVQGKDRADIREQLVISNDTVKTHVRRIYTKMNIHSKQEARKLVEEQVERTSRGM